MKVPQCRRFTIKVALCLLFILALYGSFAPCASAITLSAGDILVADPDFVHIDSSAADPFESMQPSVVKIDPVTGVHETLTSETKGGGGVLQSATQVVVDSVGRITVADPYAQALWRVDAATGDRTNLFNNSVPNQPDIVAITAIALDHDDSIVVLDHLSQTILRTDPTTGIRTLLSGPTRGTGPVIDFATGISLDPLGKIFVPVTGATPDDTAILKIDPITGDRTIVSGLGHGAGDNFFSDIRDLQVVDEHTAIALNVKGVFEVNLVTGDRQIVALPNPLIDSPSSIARLPDGKFAITDEQNGTVYKLDLATGDVSLISGNTPEFGQRIFMPQDTFVIGVPEPGTAALLATSVWFGAFRRRRRRTR